MKSNRFINIIKQAVQPKRFPVMAKKLWLRVADDRGELDIRENLKWISSQCINFKDIVSSISPSLWNETQQFSQLLAKKSKKTLEATKYDLGGGGIYPLLYFVTRLTRPKIVVETGVAAGFSSHAFLSALSRNGYGKLYSSDFPYFRLPNPEKFIGILVDDSLKTNWVLLIDGDKINLPRIAGQIPHLDIFHYDSDKTYSGKKFAIKTMKKHFHEKSILFFDDIQDDSFFHDCVTENSPSSYLIFEFEKKYVGMIGDLSTRFTS